jgi:hypothetical protein
LSQYQNADANVTGSGGAVAAVAASAGAVVISPEP